MPLKIEQATEETVVNSGLPKKGFLSHSQIISFVKASLVKHGYEIDFEQYRLSPTKDVAQGIHFLKSGHVLSWVNSYVNSFGFECVLGYNSFGNILVNRNSDVCKVRTGMSVSDISRALDNQISSAVNPEEIITNFKDDLQLLQSVRAFKNDIANIIGRLFILEDVLTLTQIGILKRDVKGGSVISSAYDLYSLIIQSLDESHPYTYLNDRFMVHKLFIDYFKPIDGVTAPTLPVVVPERNVITLNVEDYQTEDFISDPGVIFL
jgi:hypothetical protein